MTWSQSVYIKLLEHGAISINPNKVLLIDWKPIESAPTDGTEIIGFRSPDTMEILRWVKLHDGRNGWFCRDQEINTWFMFPPTHWMPLPRPPSI